MDYSSLPHLLDEKPTQSKVADTFIQNKYFSELKNLCMRQTSISGLEQADKARVQHQHDNLVRKHDEQLYEIQQ